MFTMSSKNQINPNNRFTKKIKKGATNKKMKRMRKQNAKNVQHEATVSKIVGECCKQQVTSPRMLTQCFLNEVLREMTCIASKEKSQAKIGVINQISYDLSDFVSALDTSHTSSTQAVQTNLEGQEGTHSTSRNSLFDLNLALNELRRIDDLIRNLLEDKKRIYDRLQLLNCYSQGTFGGPFSEQDEGTNMLHRNGPMLPASQNEVEENNIDISDSGTDSPNVEEVDVSDSEEDSTMDSNLVNQNQPDANPAYFDENVVNAAAFCAQRQLTLPIKEETDINIENIDNITFKRFTDLGATQMKMSGHTLMCAATSGEIIRFCFKGSMLPYLPHRTKSYDICNSSVIDMSLWNKYLIVATTNGTVYKCNSRCKVIKEFSVKHEITATTELVGLLYATSKSGHLHVINLRSMTLHKDPVELGHVVLMMKSSIFKTTNLLVFLTDKGEIIGRSVLDGFIDSTMFKFALPNMTVFDLVKNGDSPKLLTFFCGTPSSTSCLQLANDKLSQGSIIHHGTSAILIHYNLLFLGSLNGDITIVNLKSNNTYCYQRIVNGKITSFTCHMSSLYIGTESCIYCMLIDNNDDIKIK